MIATHSCGLKFTINDDLEQYRVDSLLYKEPETTSWIETWSNTKDKTFWDIGANIGIYSLYAAYIHRDLIVISIEPFYNNFLQLVENIRINNLTNIFPLCAGLWSKTGGDTLFIKDQRFWCIWKSSHSAR